MTMFCSLARRRWAVSFAAAALAVAVSAWDVQAGTPRVTDYAVATMPENGWAAIANDGVSDLVVYTAQAPDGNVDVWYQRLNADGAPNGVPARVVSDDTRDVAGDAAGDVIVFTAYDADSGISVLYWISTRTYQPFSHGLVEGLSRLHGNLIAWPSDGQAMLYDMTWLGTGHDAVTLGGPHPPAETNGPGPLDVGDTYVVWSELEADSTTSHDLWAYDHTTGVHAQCPTPLSCPTRIPDASRIPLSVAPGVDETNPVTSGPWVVWRDSTAGVLARNLRTGEQRRLYAGGSTPAIEGNLIAWMDRPNPGDPVYLLVHRISTAETFPIPMLTGGKVYGIRGNLVLHDDCRDGRCNLFVARLDFPLADAGPDQAIHAGLPVTLDGSGSTDPSGHTPLSYAWSVSSRPAGSAAVPTSPTSMITSFTPDVAGDVVLSLVVTNSDGLASDPDTVTISTTNARPVADAGPDQAVLLVGSIVTLDGTASYDDDGDPLDYEWSLVSRPEGSTATLSDSGSATPSFLADAHGDYVARLVVNDPWIASGPDAVIVSFANVAPVANAGTNQVVVVGTTVGLDGSASSDANGDPITYSWTLTSFPAGSTATLAGAATVRPSFVADLPGQYVLSLVVRDGALESGASNVTVTALTAEDTATANLSEAVTNTNELPPIDLKAPTLQNPLTNKIAAVMLDIENGDYRAALAKLEHDLLSKTDGCATAGAPDRNDWIVDCAAQAEVYPLLIQTIELLHGLI